MAWSLKTLDRQHPSTSGQTWLCPHLFLHIYTFLSFLGPRSADGRRLQSPIPTPLGGGGIRSPRVSSPQLFYKWRHRLLDLGKWKMILLSNCHLQRTAVWFLLLLASGASLLLHRRSWLNQPHVWFPSFVCKTVFRALLHFPLSFFSEYGEISQQLRVMSLL